VAKPSVQPGAVIDGFTIGECIHHGGMATLWSVIHPGIMVPLLMKIPRMSEGEDPAAIVSFEMEQMILPRLSGPHVPGCFGTGDFARPRIFLRSAKPVAARVEREHQWPAEAVLSEGHRLVGALASLSEQSGSSAQ
jgi:protein-serine/threonine kinase